MFGECCSVVDGEGKRHRLGRGEEIVASLLNRRRRRLLRGKIGIRICDFVTNCFVVVAANLGLFGF